MTNDDNATVPRTPSEPQPVSEETKPRVSGGTEEAGRTAAHVAAVTPAAEVVTRSGPPGGGAPAAGNVPGYQLLGELGKGGMGVVYKARHTKLNRVVALKMMLAGESAGHSELIRFLAEAEAVAAIKHDNVVQVFDYGEADGHPFMALEYCPGGTLSKLLPKGPAAATDPRAMAALVAQVARGVGAAHALGIVHRDLKPGNVFLDENGVPKVADFGLAKRGDGADVTRAGTGMGTPAYMAPEQAKDAEFVGPQADVWALGVILYEALTGGRPFTGTVQEIMARARTVEPVAPRAVVGAVPRDLELICLKCLSKAPHERYATAKELTDDLDRFARGEALSVRPLGRAERAARWVRRNPTAAAAWGLSSVAALLVLVVVVVVSFWRTAESAKGKLELANDELETKKKQTEEARDDAIKERGIAQRARADLQKERDKLKVFQYGRTTQVAEQECRENRHESARVRLDAIERGLRGWEWHYVSHMANGGLLFTLKGHAGGVPAAGYSADGALLVTGGEDRLVKVWDAATGAEVRSFKGHTQQVSSASFNRDGSRIVTASGEFGKDGGEVIVWDAKTGKDLLTIKGDGLESDGFRSAAFSPDGAQFVTVSWIGTVKMRDATTGAVVPAFKNVILTATSAAFSPDSKRLVTGSEPDKGALVWDAKTGKEVLKLEGHEEGVYAVGFSADGTRIITGSGDKTAKVWDAKTGTALVTLKGHSDYLTSARFSPDGTRALTGAEDNTARLWDVKTGAEIIVFKGHAVKVRAATFNPDGSRVVTGSADNGVGAANVYDARIGGEVLTLRGHTDEVTSASFSPDGSRVVTTTIKNDQKGPSGTAHLWDVKTGAEIIVFKGHTNHVHSADFDADGARIVTASWDGTARVWDAKTGSELRALKGHTGALSFARFSADGLQIVTASFDKSAKVWDAKTGTELRTLKGHTGIVSAASFSPDGLLIVTGSHDATAKVWDAKTGTELRILKGHTKGVTSASFNHDGSRIVTASYDGTAKVWDAQTGVDLLTLTGHTDSAASASFNRDGTRIVTASWDRTAKVWDAQTGADLLTLTGHTEFVLSANVSADGRRIVTGSRDTTAKVWDAGPLAPRPAGR